MLVQRTLQRFDETFGTTAVSPGPGRLDQADHARDREPVPPVVRGLLDRSTVALSRILEGLSTPVRSPALTKQRKLLLRRVSELIGGPECRVVLAMSTARSLDRVGTQLGLVSRRRRPTPAAGPAPPAGPARPRPRADAAADRRQPTAPEGPHEPVTSRGSAHRSAMVSRRSPSDRTESSRSGNDSVAHTTGLFVPGTTHHRILEVGGRAVNKGVETKAQIAEQHGVSEHSIQRANPDLDRREPRPGAWVPTPVH